MDLKEANSKLEKVDNDIEYYLKEKEILFGKTQPQAIDTTREIVSGGKRIDRFTKYTESLEEKKINEKLDEKYEEKLNLENYITNELQRIKKYKEVEQLIIFYKEICLEDYTWVQISQKVHYSVAQCKKIYRKFKEKRDIE